MVKCKLCQAEFELKNVNPEIDFDSCYFLCPLCEHRNKLVIVGDTEGPLKFSQPDK